MGDVIEFLLLIIEREILFLYLEGIKDDESD